MKFAREMRSGLVLLLAQIALAADEAPEGTCYALALSGGSNNGAWEAGVLWGFLHYGDPKDFEWAVVSGISAGSMNTAAMTPWAVGDEYAMTEWLTDTVQNMTT